MNRVLRGALTYLAASAALAGCAPIPPYGQGKLATASMDGIRPAITTREDVLLSLGPPSHRLADDHIFTYEWLEAVAMPLFPSTYLFLWEPHVFAMEFDQQGVVLRAQDMRTEYTGKKLHQWIEESPQGLGTGGSPK